MLWPPFASPEVLTQIFRSSCFAVLPSDIQLNTILYTAKKVTIIQGNISEMDIASTGSSIDEVDEVRKMAARLKLDVRRPSVLRWKAENEGGAFASRLESIRSDDKTTSAGADSEHKFAGRFKDVDEAIEWIKQELVSLKEQDHDLARQLLWVRTELSQAKLKRSCSQHRALLEDAALDMELQRNDEHDDDMLDDLPTVFGRCPPPLRGIGITRMNLCSRRFSLS